MVNKIYPIHLRFIIKDFYYRHSFSIRKISSIFHISKSTIHRWIHYIPNIHIKKKKTNKFESVRSIIIDSIKSFPEITLRELKTTISNKLHINVSISTIFNYLKQMKYSRKKVIHRYYSNFSDLQQKCSTFKNTVKDISNNDIICLDETFFVSNITANYGRSFKGSRIYKFSKINPKKYCLLMAISNKAVVGYKIYQTNINQDIFHDFLNDILLPKINNKYILMDNVGFHKTNKIMNLINNTSNKSLFIPPYSPQYNSIENVFSLIKNNFKKDFNNENIINRIINSINLLDTTKFNNIYESCLRKN